MTHVGTVRISSASVLTNVLCVPSFHFDLIYVSKLTNTSDHCFFIFSDFCYLQDLSLWKTIGMGKKRSGLYFLQGSTSSLGNSNVVSKFHFDFVNSSLAKAVSFDFYIIDLDILH